VRWCGSLPFWNAVATLRAAEDLRKAWTRLACEMAGTALLVLVGLSLVILTFGAGSPIAALLPSLKLRCARVSYDFQSSHRKNREARLYHFECDQRKLFRTDLASDSGN
jgi:hypothetical protein